MERAREIARRIQAGERVAMKRWLRKNYPKYNWLVGVASGVEALSNEVKRFGGNPEEIRAEGRKRVIALLYTEVQR